MDKKEYFSYLRKELSVRKLDKPDSPDWRRNFQKALDSAEFPAELVSMIKEKYGLPLLNVLLVNCGKSIVICNSYNIVPNKILMRAAVSYTVLGCIADSMLDGGNFSGAGKILIDDIEKYVDKLCICSDSLEDMLYSELSAGIDYIRRQDALKAELICSMLKHSASAELSSVCQYPAERSITEKSVYFSEVSSEILLAEYSGSEITELFYVIGYCFAYIDDLYDYFRDMDSAQKNTVSLYGAEEVLHTLDECLDRLKELAPPELYKFIRNELSEWN